MKKVIEHPQSMSVAAILMALLSVIHPGFHINPAVQAIVASIALLVGGANHMQGIKAASQIQQVLAALASQRTADEQPNG